MPDKAVHILLISDIGPLEDAVTAALESGREWKLARVATLRDAVWNRGSIAAVIVDGKKEPQMLAVLDEMQQEVPCAACVVVGDLDWETTLKAIGHGADEVMSPTALEEGRLQGILRRGIERRRLRRKVATREGRLEQRIAELESANKKLAEMADVDELTGLSNRRAFDKRLRAEWNRAARSRTPLSCLFLDADGFKQVNDELGHAAGDECLGKIAAAIAACLLRAGDFAARYGGDEFAILLPYTHAAGAVHVAERLRGKMEALVLATSVSVSVGVATRTPEGAGDPQSLVKSADAALYAAKRAGGNQVSQTP